MPTTAFSIGACLAFYASYLLLDATSLSYSDSLAETSRTVGILASIRFPLINVHFVDTVYGNTGMGI